MTPLYTRTGDDGTTGLFGGGRVDKSHPRVEAYGTVDELNATIGVAAAACAGDDPLGTRFLEILRTIQSRLFDLGADLATPEDSPHADKIVRLGAAASPEVEAWIDEIESGNEPLTSFVLPGGTEVAARLHLARTVCRRAERSMVALARTAPLNPCALVYVNRVSDLLFAMARRANRAAGVADTPWIPAKPAAAPPAGAH
jgi:cob(I)alamin adenosyltransferase